MRGVDRQSPRRHARDGPQVEIGSTFTPPGARWRRVALAVLSPLCGVCLSRHGLCGLWGFTWFKKAYCYSFNILLDVESVTLSSQLSVYS